MLEYEVDYGYFEETDSLSDLDHIVLHDENGEHEDIHYMRLRGWVGGTKTFDLDAPEDYDYYVKHHRVTDRNSGKVVFRACNLADCPEDAIIGRDIFDAYNWLDAVKFGMELVRQGYVDVVMNEGKQQE